MPRTLRLTHPNDRGDDVLLLQTRLVALGYVEVGEPDGIFGPDTETAVRRFKRAARLAVNGVVDDQTWLALEKASSLGSDAALPPHPGIVTAKHLRAAAPNAAQAYVEEILEPLNETTVRWRIDSPLRCAHFLAQVAHESGNFKARRENLNYSAEALLAVFPKYFVGRDVALQYARQPERIANRVYANRMENGPEASGDGWRYRGRGLIQLTGRANYRRYSEAAAKDFVTEPDLIADDLKSCADVAGWYWDAANCNRAADADDVDLVTRRINGGQNGIDDRRVRLAALRVAFGLQ